MASQPKNVGILAIDIYFPPTSAGIFGGSRWCKQRKIHYWASPRLHGVLYRSGRCHIKELELVLQLVQKSFARLYFIDFLRNYSFVDEAAKEKLSLFSGLSGDESYKSRDLEKATLQVAKHLYDMKVQPTTLIPKQVGNVYTASLYAAFASLLHNKHSSLTGKRVVMFSYGSGLTATMFSYQIQCPFSLSNIATVMNVSGKLKARHEFPPETFVETLKLMEHRNGAKDFVTSKDASLLSPGTYYLTEVDSMYRRFYAKKPDDNTANTTNALTENGSGPLVHYSNVDNRVKFFA